MRWHLTQKQDTKLLIESLKTSQVGKYISTFEEKSFVCVGVCVPVISVSQVQLQSDLQCVLSARVWGERDFMIMETIFLTRERERERENKVLSSFYQCIDVKAFRWVGFIFHGKILAMLLCCIGAQGKSKDSHPRPCFSLSLLGHLSLGSRVYVSALRLFSNSLLSPATCLPSYRNAAPWSTPKRSCIHLSSTFSHLWFSAFRSVSRCPLLI